LSRPIDKLDVMLYYVGMNKYHFALKEVLADLKLNPTQAYKKYFSKGENYLSRQTVYNLCGKPDVVYIETMNRVCNAIGLVPSDLWRIEK
jgi:DNA-binding Xre family transcriptional regulator